MQLAFLRALQTGKLIITVTGESLPNLRKGIYRDAEAIFGKSTYLQEHILNWNKTDRIINFKNGSLIEFISNLDEQSAKAGKRDVLIVDEAQGVSWPIFFTLAIRTRGQIFILYNPTAPFWAHEKLIGTTAGGNDMNADVQLFITDHRHNCFLTKEEHDKIENIKDKALWNVYARGRTGNITGLIFTNWKMIPDTDFPWNEDGKFGGLDIGYTNDPTAAVICCRVGDSVFIHELCYTTAMTAIQIKQLFTANGFTPDDPIYCEHDPDMIRQLRNLDILAIPARKGQGSIRAGISKMNEYNIFYTASSKNLKTELSKYMWIIDPDTGKSTNTPIDAWNHLCDSVRYAVYTHFWRQD